jgi:cyanophycinase
MISRGIIEEALLKSDIEMSTGLGLISGLIVDTHFIKRGRLGRLAYAVGLNAHSCTGIGIGEDAAVIISGGNEMECSGSGMVIIIDGSGMKATNIAQADDHTPIAIEDLKLHILTNGCKYFLKEKKFVLGQGK